MTKAGAREVGLCERCRHARIVETPRSVFWMCGLSATDPRFDKYPRLPIRECDGHEPGEPTRVGAKESDTRGS
jgi:hypothetical protein